MKLSILICTVTERKIKFNTLLNKLNNLCKGYDIEILYNNKPRYDAKNGISVGEKRQSLIDKSTGDFFIFIDDDDDVTDDFINIIYPHLQKKYDVITSKTIAYIDNEKFIIDTSIFYTNEQLNHEGEETKRYPSVSSIWNRKLIKKVRFKKINNGEDFQWSMRLKPKTEKKLEDILYLYNFSTENTIASKAAYG
jgi:hypothetical protein